MNELSKFYKDLLESLGLVIDDNGLINIVGGGIKKPLDINGVPLYLPTDENVKTAVEMIDNKPTPVKVMFNPLEEDVFKGTNESFLKLKNIIELRLLSIVGQIGISMMTIVSDSNEDMTDMELIKFVNVLNKHKTGKRKSMVDEKTIKSWISMYSAVLSRLEYKYARFYIKKGKKVDGIQYNRIGTITFPFIEKFREAMERKDKTFLDVKLRVADIHVIESLFDFMFGILEPKDVNQFGSFNKKSPSLHTLLLMYDSVYKRLSPIVNTIINYGIEDDIKEALVLNPLPIKAELLGDFIDALESEVKRVPNEKATITANNDRPSIIKEVKPSTTNSNAKGGFWDKVKTQPTQQPTQQPPVQQQANPFGGPVPQVVQQPAMPVSRPAPQVIQQPPAMQPVASNPFGRTVANDDPWAPKGPAFGQPMRQPAYGMPVRPAHIVPWQ
jgi:hypothetical protein